MAACLLIIALGLSMTLGTWPAPRGLEVDSATRWAVEVGPGTNVVGHASLAVFVPSLLGGGVWTAIRKRRERAEERRARDRRRR